MPREILIALCFICVYLLPVTASVSQAEERPNILFLFADDWGRYAGIYSEILGKGTANDVAKTPHIDKIARSGVTFTHAYVSAPSCTPCRSSLLSGQHFYRTGRGAILLGAKWDDTIPTYPLLLKKNGYHIGYTYKVWAPGTPSNAGYGGRANAYTVKGPNFNGFSQYAMKNGGTPEAKEELYQQVTGSFQKFLDKKEDAQPFCYWFWPHQCSQKMD